MEGWTNSASKGEPRGPLSAPPRALFFADSRRSAGLPSGGSGLDNLLVAPSPIRNLWVCLQPGATAAHVPLADVQRADWWQTDAQNCPQAAGVKKRWGQSIITQGKGSAEWSWLYKSLTPAENVTSISQQLVLVWCLVLPGAPFSLWGHWGSFLVPCQQHICSERGHDAFGWICKWKRVIFSKGYGYLDLMGFERKS